MTAAQRVRAIKFLGWTMAALFCAGAGDSALAQFYKCTLKGGKVEMRDFPCDLSGRPVSPAPVAPASPARNQGQAQPSSSTPIAGFGSWAKYQAARDRCFKLLSQYDAMAPLMRCSIDDPNCLRHAEVESQAISRRLDALPEWSSWQCDLVLQIESDPTRANAKTFEVVGTVAGCKYFVAEQGGSYSLAEQWACPRPLRGDTGEGEVNSFGVKEVKFNGMSCSILIDYWLLGRSGASEKLQEKCR